MSDSTSADVFRRVFWALAGVLIVCIVLTGQTRNTTSDPRGTLLLSQTLAQHGEVRLDRYGSKVLQRYGYVIQQKNDHFYYYFPMGSAVLSAPFVGLANTLGLDMLNDEETLQMALVSLCSLGLLVLLYRTARLFLSRRSSYLLALLCWLGSSYASVLATALWSHDFAVLFASLAIYLALRKMPANDTLASVAIGISLFLAYFCRPTLALLAPFLLLYLLHRQPCAALKAGTALALSLLLFCAWSLHEFSQWLPDYYLPSRLESDSLGSALYGNLLSPARGLLVFSPFLLLPLLLLPAQAIRSRQHRPLLLVALAWPIAHWIIISRFPHWWAGWSYSSRLMVDVLPGLFVGLFASLGLAREWRRWLYVPLLALGAFALFVNTWQGLYNPYTARWNMEPNIDAYPEYLFNWDYPQFLHTPARHTARLTEFQMRGAAPLPQDFDLDFQSDKIGFIGFSTAEPEFRWTDGPQARILFQYAASNTHPAFLRLKADFLGEQRLTVRLNGSVLGRSVQHGANQVIVLKVAPEQLIAGLNTLTFELPDARRPPSADPRVLGMALRTLSLE
ncbi:glycosyltransferase family 39 protein [Pseudomonas sp.]|uniref:glycosyltransferase family 39 protein n=1 Tax=Pseudomonas sp. TaxID=306 RepID=UPI0031D7F9F0